EAVGVARDRIFTCSSIAQAGEHVESFIPIGRVSNVAAEEEGVATDRCVMVSASVAEQRAITARCVVVSGGMARKRERSIGRVEAAAVVKSKRVNSNGRVLCSGGV